LLIFLSRRVSFAFSSSWYAACCLSSCLSMTNLVPGCPSYLQVDQIPHPPLRPRPSPTFQTRNRTFTLPTPSLPPSHSRTRVTENVVGNIPPVLGDVESSPRSDRDRGRARRAGQRGSRRADERQGGRSGVAAWLGRERHQVGRGGARKHLFPSFFFF
jgi:hypothetical protein